jgi:hypothetical protein
MQIAPGRQVSLRAYLQEARERVGHGVGLGTKRSVTISVKRKSVAKRVIGRRPVSRVSALKPICTKTEGVFKSGLENCSLSPLFRYQWILGAVSNAEIVRNAEQAPKFQDADSKIVHTPQFHQIISHNPASKASSEDSQLFEACSM